MDILKKAIKEASRKLPFAPMRSMRQNLEFAADDKAEAYIIGAEEAQREIIRRLSSLAGKGDPGKVQVRTKART